MPTKTMTAKGVLTPTNKAEVNAGTIETVDNALRRVGLWFFAGKENRALEDGTLEFGFSVATEESHHAILSFVKQLAGLLEEPEIAMLGLSGHLMVTADTRDEPFVMRVSVKNGKIFYQDAHITWSQEVPF